MLDDPKNGRTLAPNAEKAKPPPKKTPHACKRGWGVGLGFAFSRLKNIAPHPQGVALVASACAGMNSNERWPLSFSLCVRNYGVFATIKANRHQPTTKPK